MAEIQRTWDLEWKSAEKLARGEVAEIAAVVLIGFCWSIRGEEIYLTSLPVMFQFLEDTRIHYNMGHVMVTMQGMSKGETGNKWHML